MASPSNTEPWLAPGDFDIEVYDPGEPERHFQGHIGNWEEGHTERHHGLGFRMRPALEVTRFSKGFLVW